MAYLCGNLAAVLVFAAEAGGPETHCGGEQEAQGRRDRVLLRRTVSPVEGYVLIGCMYLEIGISLHVNYDEDASLPKKVIVKGCLKI